MGFITPPVPPKLSAGLASIADSTAVAVPGGIYFHKTSTDKWSLLMYYKANASVVKGKGLVRALSTYTSHTLQTAATTDVNTFACQGAAAADVSNTGYYSFCYIGGYCPDIYFGSAASAVMHGLSGSTAGAFTQYSSAGSTIAINTRPFFAPALAHATTTADGTASGTITPILW